MTQPQPGWYPDPAGDPTKLRWWDGTNWTDQYAASGFSAAGAGQAAQAANPVNAGQASTYAAGALYPMTETDRTLRLIAFILNVITIVFVCWTIIPLAWMIPMTVRSWGIYKGTKPNTVAFGVCTLLFLDIISGILLLVSKKDA